MKIHESSDALEMSTGRLIQANRGFIGINSSLAVAQGYDGGFDEEEMSAEERRELADYMISLWTLWKSQPLAEIGAKA